MFYPKHHCRTYCLYLGSLEIGGIKYDFGVYESPTHVSHAIVFGPEDHEYISGPTNFMGEDYTQSSTETQINLLLYKDFLKSREKGDEKEFEFTVTLYGTGVDVDEAWEQARNRVYEGDLPKFDDYLRV